MTGYENELKKQTLLSCFGTERKPQIFIYGITDSTNQRAKEHAAELKGEFDYDALFIAAEQTAGRGRRGRSFLSDSGRGLYFSYLFRPEKELCTDATMITTYAAVCVSRAIEELTGTEAQIKWVNDVYLNGKKAAGILTEGEFLPGGDGFLYVSVGIGINLYSLPFPDELASIATDIEIESGVRVDINELLYRITAKLRNFAKEKDGFIEEYRRRSYLTGKAVTVEKLTERYSARVLGIDDRARLILETERGVEHLLTGDVSVRTAI